MTHPVLRVYGQYFASLRNAFAFEQELPPDREEATDVMKAMFANSPSRLAASRISTGTKRKSSSRKLM